jgi:hypothetical protein
LYLFEKKKKQPLYVYPIRIANDQMCSAKTCGLWLTTVPSTEIARIKGDV